MNGIHFSASCFNINVLPTSISGYGLISMINFSFKIAFPTIPAGSPWDKEFPITTITSAYPQISNTECF